MNSKSKCLLRVQDRISLLPDELLCNIVSFLETKYAVRTCVLSRRWKNIWASVTSLDFDQRVFHDLDKFRQFVDYVLLFRYSAEIKKFRLWLRGSDVDHSRVNAWINTAIRRNVVELDFCAGYPVGSELIELPKSLIMCKTLVNLKLGSQFVTNIPASGCFPSLKFLHLTFYSDAIVSMRNIISNCPILENLTVGGFLRSGHSLNLNITAPALKTLIICFGTSGKDGNHYIINCPKLENLDVTEDVPSTYYWGKAKSLVKASIFLLRHCSNEQPSFYSVTPLLAGISNVTDLCLSAHCFEVGSLPAYENLRQLKLEIQNCFNWELLTVLLKRSPILESLVLEHEVNGCHQEDSDDDNGFQYDENSGSEEGSEHEDDSDHEEGSENEQSSDHEEGPANEQSSDHEEGPANEQSSDHQEGPANERGPEHQWNPPDCVPNCLFHLKIVSIEGFTGNGDELEVAKYLLKYGRVLNKMTISLDDLDVNEKEKIYKEFAMVPRGSRSCIVEFI